MTWISTFLFLALILFGIVTNTSAEQSTEKKGTDIPCFNDGVLELGIGSQKDCLAREIPGFAGYTVSDCVMTVYLKSLDQVDRARYIFEPLFRESNVGRYSCGSRTRVVIRSVRYSSTELKAWYKLANNQEIRELKSFHSIDIDEDKNAVDIFIKDEADIPRAREILAKFDIPEDALILRGRGEMDKSRMAQIRDGELLVPVFISDKHIGDLVLGKTTLTQAESIYPKSSSPKSYEGRPRKPKGHPEPKLGEVSPKAKLVFNPWLSNDALYFDKNNRLVIFEEFLPVYKGHTVAEVSKIYSGLRKTDTVDGYNEMQTELTPCAVLMLLVNEDEDEIDMSAYAYTCKTER